MISFATQNIIQWRELKAVELKEIHDRYGLKKRCVVGIPRTLFKEELNQLTIKTAVESR